MAHPTFEDLVRDALDGLPDWVEPYLEDVAVQIEEHSAPDQRNLYGLYEGIPLTERGDWYAGVLPDRITIFRGPLLRHCHSPAEVVAEVRITVVHEVAHHFGIDDHTLNDLGYG